MMKPHKLRSGATVWLERRRYPGQTYCWAYRQDADGQFISLGDPWAAVTPAMHELEAAFSQTRELTP